MGKKPATASSDSAASNSAAIHGILKYSSLLFAFPAAALVNYAGGALDSKFQFEPTLALFLLFIFLILEVYTTQCWLQIEYFRRGSEPPKKYKALHVAKLDVVRVFFLTMLYIELLKAYGASGDIPKLNTTSVLVFGFFLLANFIWNWLVSPEHKLAFDQYVNSFDDTPAHKLYVNVLWGIYGLEWLLFWIIFPISSILIIANVCVEKISYLMFLTGYLPVEFVQQNLNLKFVLIVMLIQAIAKLLQAWLLTHVIQSLVPNTTGKVGIF
jgi:hypothetical protein